MRDQARRVPRLAWLIGGVLILLPWWLAYFYRVLGVAGVVGCALPLS